MYEEGARYDVHRPLGGEGGMGGRGIEKEKASEGETKIAIGEQAKVAISCCYSKN